jgi:hypothetical protein
MFGLRDGSYKARYQNDKHKGDIGWKGVKSLPWRSTFDMAQAELNLYAKERNWKEW